MVAGTPPLTRTTLSRRDARATFSGYGKPGDGQRLPDAMDRVSRTVGVDCRLQRNDGPLRVDGLAHLLRDAEEAIVGQVAPPRLCAAPLGQTRSRCSS
jgi:hypothetical protein